MLTASRPLETIVIALTLTAFATPSPAESLWWIADGSSSPELWSDGDNWKNTVTGTPAQTQLHLRTYLTDTDHLELMHGVLQPIATLEDGDVEDSGRLYIGGWGVDFDDQPDGAGVTHGDPGGRSGELIVEGGELTIHEAPEPAPGDPEPNPVCNYIRLGYRGAKGTIRQSGGKITNCGNITFGYKRAETLATYELSGGEAAVGGLGIGNNGVGIMTVTGDGQVTTPPYSNRVPESQTKSSIIVGASAWTEEGGFIPGAGLLYQDSGSIERTGNVVIAASPTSSGILTVRGDGVLDVGEGNYADVSGGGLPNISTGRIYVGESGAGALTVTGGYVEAHQVNVGRSEGGLGQLSISGGCFKVIGEVGNGSQGLTIGSARTDTWGIGHMTVIGGGNISCPTQGGFPIEVVGKFRVDWNSRLSFVYADGFPRAQPIWVHDQARFDTGSTISVRPAVPAGNQVNPLVNGVELGLVGSFTSFVDGGVTIVDDHFTCEIREVNFFDTPLYALYVKYDDTVVAPQTCVNNVP